jgi:hypothetical protein
MASVTLPFELPTGGSITFKYSKKDSRGDQHRLLFLTIGGVELPLTRDQAEKIILQHVPEEDKVWCYTEERESFGYDHEDDKRPAWSVYPHLQGWILGNTHYRTKARAETEMLKELGYKIEDIERDAANRVGRLQARIHEILGTADTTGV